MRIDQNTISYKIKSRLGFVYGSSH